MSSIALHMLAVAAPAKDVTRANNALVLFLCVAVVLGILLAGVVLMLAAHRIRRRAAAAKPTENLPDPWRESAHRIYTPEAESPPE